MQNKHCTIFFKHPVAYAAAAHYTSRYSLLWPKSVTGTSGNKVNSVFNKVEFEVEVALSKLVKKENKLGQRQSQTPFSSAFFIPKDFKSNKF